MSNIGAAAAQRHDPRAIDRNRAARRTRRSPDSSRRTSRRSRACRNRAVSCWISACSFVRAAGWRGAADGLDALLAQLSGGIAARYARPSAVVLCGTRWPTSRRRRYVGLPWQISTITMCWPSFSPSEIGGLREVRHLLHHRPRQLAHVEAGKVRMAQRQHAGAERVFLARGECVRNPMRVSVCVRRETVGFGRPVRRAIS